MPGETEKPVPAVVALAGRRIDAAESVTRRFPLANVGLVRRRINDVFVEERAEALVCSAACGADLLALDVAEQLNLRRRIVLPFPAERFRETSVVDRPGDWGPLFDRLIASAMATRDLLMIGNAGGDDDAAYAAANAMIIQEAQQLANVSEQRIHYRPLAVLVWEGQARAGTDATQGFRELALKASFDERSILTR
jgi:hypothetical protein